MANTFKYNILKLISIFNPDTKLLSIMWVSKAEFFPILECDHTRIHNNAILILTVCVFLLKSAMQKKLIPDLPKLYSKPCLNLKSSEIYLGPY